MQHHVHLAIVQYQAINLHVDFIVLTLWSSHMCACVCAHNHVLRQESIMDSWLRGVAGSGIFQARLGLAFANPSKHLGQNIIVTYSMFLYKYATYYSNMQR